MRRALAPILFEDEELPEQRKRRDPILPAKASDSAKQKKSSRQTADGFPVHSFKTLMSELATRSRVTYRLKSKDLGLTVKQIPYYRKIRLDFPYAAAFATIATSLAG
jgi:hypothetical protein